MSDTHLKISEGVLHSILNKKELFDGMCPFTYKQIECGLGCMTVEECNTCIVSKEYREGGE